ncbi:MAG: prolipoprotein diacylglyceryl transferase [Candidatus Moraniibacteriota bacterium]
MMNWWQHIPEHINPIVCSFGSFSLSWYSVTFLLGTLFSLSFLWGVTCRDSIAVLSREEFLDFSLFLLCGAIIGARFGYAIFYNAAFFVAHPASLVSPFDLETGVWIGIAGMSAHGGIVGIVLAVLVFAWKYRKSVCVLLDAVALSVPIAIFFGRLGNFFMGELFGRVTSVSWGMFFPRAGDVLLHHPSQLYEACGEGMVLWAALLVLSKRMKIPGQLFAWALGLYGGIRFFLEYLREPDRQIGFIWSIFTLGQILCLALIVAAGILLWWMREGRNAILSRTG